MRLKWEQESLFTEDYPSLTIEELQKILDNHSKEKLYLQFRMEHSKCCCENQDATICTDEDTDGTVRSFFYGGDSPLCSYCEKCSAPFPSHWIGAGYSWIDHFHPRLLYYLVDHTTKLLEKAIFCKEKNYESLSQADLENLIRNTYAFSRSLNRTQTDFMWSNDETPSGLVSEIENTQKELEALEFELKSRSLRGLMKLNVTSSVQPTID